MSTKITIRVRETGGGSTARVLGVGLSASCTMGPKWAAERAAEKHFGARPFTLVQTKAGSCGREPYEFTAEAET